MSHVHAELFKKSKVSPNRWMLREGRLSLMVMHNFETCLLHAVLAMLLESSDGVAHCQSSGLLVTVNSSDSKCSVRGVVSPMTTHALAAAMSVANVRILAWFVTTPCVEADSQLKSKQTLQRCCGNARSIEICSSWAFSFCSSNSSTHTFMFDVAITTSVHSLVL